MPDPTAAAAQATRLTFAVAKADRFKVVFSDGSVVEGPADSRDGAMEAVSRVLRERAQRLTDSINAGDGSE